MPEFLTTLLIGIVLIVIGIINMTGNVSMLHRYHTKRVSEENKKPFGRLVGTGTAIIGAALMVFGSLMYAFERTQNPAFSVAGTVILIVFLVVGLGISFFAMIKYNKGIF